MSGAAVFRRDEFMDAHLDMGTMTIALLVMAEQLAEQGWISVLLDPEGELEALYGDAVHDPQKLQNCIRGRHHPMLVVRVRYAAEFSLYAKAIMEVVDEERKPVFLVIDEAQIFSSPLKRKKDDIGESADLMNDFVQRGRKRALDIGVTAHRFSGT